MRGLREHDGRSFQFYFRVLRGPDYARISRVKRAMRSDMSL